MTNSEDRVDVVTAAHLLGISPAGVRQRIHRGKLPAVQVAGRWFVVLRETEHRYADVITEAEQELSERNTPDSSTQQQATTETEQQNNDVVSTLQELVTQLRLENSRLWNTVEARDKEIADRAREVSELHVLLQREQARTLPAPKDFSLEPNEKDEPVISTQSVEKEPEKRRRWWQVWG